MAKPPTHSYRLPEERSIVRLAAVTGKCPSANDNRRNASERTHAWRGTIAVAVAALAFVASAYQVYVLNDLEVRSLRAYVFAVPAHMRAGLDESHRVGIDLKLVDHGRTPAKDADMTGEVDIYPAKLPRDLQPAALSPEIRQSLVLIPNDADPPDGWIWAPRPFTPAEIQEATSVGGADKIYAFVRVSYRDVFGNQRYTDDCYFIDPLSVTRNATGAITGLRWTTCDGYRNFN